MVKEHDYGIIHQAFLWCKAQAKKWKQAREGRKIGKLIKEAEEWAKTTGHKYYVVRFKGKIQIIPKKTFKHWIRTGHIKKGLSIQDIEARVLYITRSVRSFNNKQQTTNKEQGTMNNKQ